MSDEFCTCSDEGLEPFWLQFPDGRIGCKRCRKPHGYTETDAPEPGPRPPRPQLDHPVAAAVLIAAALTPDLPEPPQKGRKHP